MSATQFFEGSEKKLEIILRCPSPELRSNDDGRWHRVVDACGAKIISKISSPLLDAYLLSESSLFVWDDRILMVTCGQTALIHSVVCLMGLLDKGQIGYVFYERKNMLDPAKQRSSFEEDVEILGRYIPGSHHRLGSLDQDHVSVFYAALKNRRFPEDTTYQILMHELEDDVADTFSTKPMRSAEEVTRLSGLNRVFPGMRLDAHLFDPCGYSLNGIRGAHYFSVHVTPQIGASFASFETNLRGNDYNEILQCVTAVFAPRRFSTVLTSNVDRDRRLFLDSVAEPLAGYCARETSILELEAGYSSYFMNCERCA